jgi:general secretion pathway protein G
MTKNKGFTLIELLVVIAIIGLLSTLAVVALNNARAKSRDAKRVSDIKSLQTALELYYQDQNGYPSLAAGQALGSGNYGALCTSGFATANGCTNPYMGQIQANPTPGGAGYTYYGNGTSYSITFNLETGTGNLPAGNHTASPSGLQ